MRPVCGICNVEMQCEKTGAHWVTYSKRDEPYQIYRCDKFICPKCKAQVLVGFGNSPVKEHYQDGFESYLEEIGNDKNEVVHHEGA